MEEFIKEMENKDIDIYLKLKKSSWDNFFRVMKWRKNPIELMNGHGSIGNFWTCIQTLESQFREDKMREMEEFVKEMEKILAEKEPKYLDTWKDCNIKLLKTKLNRHVREFDSSDINRSKRVLLHIANYSFLLYNRLSEIN